MAGKSVAVITVDDLNGVRARADRAAKELINQKTGQPNLFHNEQGFRPVRASARDVPDLLALVDTLSLELANKTSKM